MAVVAAERWATRGAATSALPAVTEELARAARECGERLWLSFFEGDSHSFAEVEEAAGRLAAGLAAELGIGRGDRVALFCSNRFEFVEAWFAIQRLGAIVVPINTSHRGPMLRRMLERAGVRAVLAEPAFEAAVAEAVAG